MINQEFSIEFDILYNNISSNKAPGLNEYEKSVFLTKAQEQIVTELYSGRNTAYNSFEETEEQRRYLSNLVVDNNCVQYKLIRINKFVETLNEVIEKQINGPFCSHSEVYDESSIIVYIKSEVGEFIVRKQDGTVITPSRREEVNNLYTRIYYKLPKEALYEKEEISFRYTLPNLPFPETFSIHIDPLDDTIIKSINNNSYLFSTPSDVMFITYECAIINTSYPEGTSLKEVSVYPVSQNELSKILKNPFRGPSKNRVLRLDINNNSIELISSIKINEYKIRYIRKPNPIILSSLEDGLTINGISKESECELDSSLHRTILDRAVALALQTMYSK